MRRQRLLLHTVSLIIHRHDLTETTRAMAKRGSEDLKKLAAQQATLVRPLINHALSIISTIPIPSSTNAPLSRRPPMTSRCR